MSFKTNALLCIFQSQYNTNDSMWIRHMWYSLKKIGTGEYFEDVYCKAKEISYWPSHCNGLSTNRKLDYNFKWTDVSICFYQKIDWYMCTRKKCKHSVLFDVKFQTIFSFHSLSDDSKNVRYDVKPYVLTHPLLSSVDSIDLNNYSNTSRVVTCWQFLPF